ncbi:hypothetical protein [Cryobacterium sp. CG_9.6]|uniref:hypothetical protein n=1 Tax=Cryobacterium sp. CG_9.6 TaxID=2760710 RepID=UPI0024758260|nr:hypothetical protein [Cryobacterium sp. CG_9.6]MDH6238051.1 type II secretory pathway pseudopilin PulG [Cryobacterium sp. CG_9.6]
MADSRSDGSEAGVTLIELIVYSALLVVVSTLVVGFFLSGLTTVNRVRDVSAASNTAQVVADSVATNIRNSTDFGLSTPSGTDQFLVARTAQRGATLTWGCVAWYYSAAGAGTIYFKQSTAAILAPTPAQLATWILVEDSVTPASGTRIFAATGQQLSMNFVSQAGAYPPVVISSSATSRAGASGNLTCF